MGEANPVKPVFCDLKLMPAFTAVFGRINGSVRITHAQCSGLLRVKREAAGHVRVPGRESAAAQPLPRLAAVVAAKNLSPRAAGLRQNITTEPDGIVGAGADGAIAGPGGRPIFCRAQIDTVGRSRMIDHGDRVGAAHAVLALAPAFSAIVGLIGAETGACEQSLQARWVAEKAGASASTA